MFIFKTKRVNKPSPPVPWGLPCQRLYLLRALGGPYSHSHFLRIAITITQILAATAQVVEVLLLLLLLLVFSKKAVHF